MDSQNDEIEAVVNEFKKEPQNFMFFLGAGFSKKIGLPSGAELAEILEMEFKEKVEEDLKESKKIDLDNLIALLLKKGVLKNEICEIIKKNLDMNADASRIASERTFLGLFFRIINEGVLKRNQDSVKISIATTNWDETLLKIFGDKAASIYSRNEVNERLNIPNRGIVIYHLHGSIEDCDSMKLTSEEKGKINEDSVMWTSFKHDVNTKRVIFIGYSFRDENIFSIYRNLRKGSDFREYKDYIIVNGEESKERIEAQLRENNIEEAASVIVMDSFNFLIKLADSMGLVQMEEKIELETEKEIEEKLKDKKGLIITGHPLSGLTTLYINHFHKFTGEKLCLEYRYDEDEKSSFMKVMDQYLKNSKEIALITPEYLYEVYFNEYLENIHNPEEEIEKLKNKITKSIERIRIRHSVSEEEARNFLDILINESIYGNKFDDKLKEKILELIEKEGLGSYPLKLLRDVFQDVNMKIARGEDTEKIKKDIDEKVKFRDDVEKILGVNVLFGLTYIGADISYFSSSMSPRYYNYAKKIAPGISNLLGTLSTVTPFLAIGLVIYDIYEFIKDVKEKKISEIDSTIRLKKYWDSLNDSERKMLCYRLDMKNNLRPGASEEFLKNTLTENKLEDLRKEINNIKNDVRKNLEDFERKLDNFKKEYGEVLDELSKVNEDVKNIFDMIKTILDMIKSISEQVKKVDISSSGLEQVDDIKTLQQYYNVDPNVIANVHDKFEISNGEVDGNRSIMNFSTLVKELLDWNEESDPWIYVITGPSGTGKSWFTYRVIYEIFNKNELDIRNRSGERSRFSFFIIKSPSEFRYPEVNESNQKNLMFIDDSAIEIDKINDLEKILDKFLGKDKGAMGPVIITIEYNKWKKLLETKRESLYISGLKHRVSKLEKKVAQIFLEKTSDEEISMVLDNLSKSSEYSNIIIPDEIKGKIVKKAEGLPIIIKIFLDSIKHQKAKDKEQYEVTDIDVEEIDKDPTEYAMNKLWGYYIPQEWRNNKGNYRKEISQILSLLNSVVKLNKPVPLAILDRNFLEEILNCQGSDQNLLYKILNNIRVEPFNIDYNIETNKIEVRMLFFKLDKEGFLTPIHDIVRGGIDRLIDKYDLIDYTEQIINEIKIILKKKLDPVFNGSECKITHSLKNAYYLLSLSIMSDRINYQVKALKFTFESNKKIESSNSNKNIDLLVNQLNNIFLNVLPLLNEHESLELIKNGEDVIEKLFKTKDQEDRLESWKFGLETLGRGTASEEIKGIMDRNKLYFIELLISEDYIIRSSAWLKVTVLIDMGIISKEDAIEKKEYFKELLISEDYIIRLNSWLKVTDLIDMGIISKEDAIEKKEYFKELLISEDDNIRSSAWNRVIVLIDKGIISKEDATYFKELLSSEDYGIRLDSWLKVTDLIDKGIISKEEAIEKKEYFKELLISEDYIIRSSAWDIVTVLIDKGIISNEEAIEKKEYFKELLISEDYIIRRFAWYI
ncbi:MAG: SIR2 family protein, partial [Thermoplasmatales archaeon]